MSDKIADMIANPTAFGFDWGYGKLEKKGMVLTEKAPFIIHENVELMQEHFGKDYFLAMANGQSGRVRDQTLREDIYDNRDLLKDPDAMKRIVLEKALGTRAKRARVTIVEKLVEVRVYVADDGTEFTDKADFLAHQAELKYNL